MPHPIIPCTAIRSPRTCLGDFRETGCYFTLQFHILTVVGGFSPEWAVLLAVIAFGGGAHHG